MSLKNQNSKNVSLKKLLDKELSTLNHQLMTAKNDYFRVLVYDKLHKLLQNEIDQWLLKHAKSEQEITEENYQLTLVASKHIAELSSLVNKIKVERDKIIKSALAIQKAMMNSHELKSQVIFE